MLEQWTEGGEGGGLVNSEAGFEWGWRLHAQTSWLVSDWSVTSCTNVSTAIMQYYNTQQRASSLQRHTLSAESGSKGSAAKHMKCCQVEAQHLG